MRSAEVLSSGESATEAETVHGRVLCLHGYRTSSTVLRQQMVALSAVLERAGYGPFVVPNGPYKSKGAAQFAEGLDEEDSYGWWQYPDDDAKDAPPIGLSESLEYVRGVAEKAAGPIVGVVGFSQGGAMAAQVANAVGARWALLFSPIYVPGSPAQCDCPTLVAFDRTDEVFGETETLLGELERPERSVERVEHGEGHRLPADREWYSAVAAFVEANSEKKKGHMRN